MNLSPRWADTLAAAGFEAMHWSAIGSPGATDETIMGFARAGSWIVLTNDLDFGIMLAVSLDDGPSVVQLRARHTNPDVHGPTVVRALRWAEERLVRGALLTVDPGRMRVRLLPLRPPPAQTQTAPL
jgi:predicted nuclease of predicted toxin-antitoxin system